MTTPADEALARDPATEKALELLDAMAETWVEKNGIEQQLKTIPLNCTTEEFQERARALILRFVKLAHVEGLYTGRMSHEAAAHGAAHSGWREVSLDLKSLVDGIGGLGHGTWRDEHGARLKDTQEWVAFYNAVSSLPPAPTNKE